MTHYKNRLPGLIVVGGGISYDGKPSEATKHNALAAARIIKDGTVDERDVFLLGAGPDPRHDYAVTEADAMAEMLQTYVPSGLVPLLGRFSHDTFMNIREFCDIRNTQEDPNHHYLIVSSDGHAQRTEAIARMAFWHTGVSFAADPTDMFVSDFDIRQERILTGVATVAFKATFSKTPIIRIHKAAHRYDTLLKPVKRLSVRLRPTERYVSDQV